MSLRIATIAAAAALAAGVATGALTTPRTVLLYTANGSVAGNLFGTSIAALGGDASVPADGYDDLIVGAPAASSGAGQVRIVSGLDGSTIRTVSGSGSDYFGFSVAPLGLVNGDGVSDFAVGALLGSYVRIVSGVDGSTIRTISGTAGAGFGASVSSAGLIDNDSVQDVLVGAPFEQVSSLTQAGTARVYSGATGSQIGNTINGTQQDEFLGSSVAGVGIVNNGDSVPDFIVGSYNWDDVPGSLQDCGRAQVFSGVPNGSGNFPQTFQVQGTQRGEILGAIVGGIGNVNADGYDDFATGSPYYSAVVGEEHHGRVRAFSGSNASLLWNQVGLHEYDALSRVTGFSDIDGDGKPDVLVGAPGTTGEGQPLSGWVAAVVGLSGTARYFMFGDSGGDSLGWSVAAAGDLNNDGFDDVAIGAPGESNTGDNAGSAKVFTFK